VACAAVAECHVWTYHPVGGHSPLQCSFATQAAPHHSAGAISGSTEPLPPPPPPPPPPPSPPRPKPTPPPIGPVHPPLGYQPNIIFIQTDDQDVELGGTVLVFF
jgi:hypothetical protein